eukprot:1441367-Rhodomonas_salina.1
MSRHRLTDITPQAHTHTVACHTADSQTYGLADRQTDAQKDISPRDITQHRSAIATHQADYTNTDCGVSAYVSMRCLGFQIHRIHLHMNPGWVLTDQVRLGSDHDVDPP